MKWKHCLDELPVHGSIIVRLLLPYECYEGNFKFHYTMGMEKYTQYCSNDELWQSFKQYEEIYGKGINFWWAYADEFNFPKDDNKVTEC